MLAQMKDIFKNSVYYELQAGILESVLFKDNFKYQECGIDDFGGGYQ